MLVVVDRGAQDAQAVPVGSEYPQSWQISGNTARGTTASGVGVTMTLSGAGTSYWGNSGGDPIFTGPRPSYIPNTRTAALRFGSQNCTNTAVDGCGVTTYRFDRPVKNPILYVTDFGAAVGDGNSRATSFKNHPMTVQNGTFALDSANSQSPRMEIKGSGSTIGLINPNSYRGTSIANATSCGTFGCGAYLVATDSPTITELTFTFGYEGTGTNLDYWGQILGVTPAEPGLELEKSASPTEISAAGEEIAYSFEVTNTGETELTDPQINETQFSGTGDAPEITCPAGTLGIGESVTCTGTYTATQADVDAGSITNTATATATAPGSAPDPTSNESSAEVTAAADPSLAMEKTVDGEFAAGEEVTYSFAVTNTGNVTLSPVEIEETEFTGNGDVPQVTCPADADALAPGDSVTCTATYTLTQADIDQGSVENTAHANGAPPGEGDPVRSEDDSAQIPFEPVPALTIEKTANRDTLELGRRITYSFAVTNTGNVTLSDIVINETEWTGAGELSEVSCPAGAGALAPGDAVTCTATYTVQQADIDRGSIANTATAQGVPPGGDDPVVSDPDEAEVTVDPAPGIAITKSADTTDLELGDEIVYSFVVENTGNVTLHDIVVNEGEFTGTGEMSEISCPALPNGLAPLTSVTCTATYTVTQEDVDSGTLENTASVTGTPPSGEPPTDESTVRTPNDPDPGLSIEKSTASEDLVEGEEITYWFRVQNTGDVTLRDISIDDSDFSGAGELSEPVCEDGTPALEPGAVVWCSATYTVTQDDVDRGSIRNVATATGTPPQPDDPVTSESNEVQVPAEQTPAVGLVKTAAPDSYDVGDEITYSFAITNTGNVSLSDLAVTEGDFSGTGELSEIVCPAEPTTIAPGESVNCTATYTATAEDVDRGSLENTATAQGTPPEGEAVTSDPSQVRVPAEQNPGLEVVKTADSDTLVAGETITYSLMATNTGNVTLTDVRVEEGEFSGAGEMPVVTCAEDSVTLAPGESVTCTASYEVVQADVDSGSLRNTAIGTGSPPDGGTVESPPGESTIPADPQPGLELVKSVDTDELIVGEDITYSFEVTNTGNVTLHGITIDETDFSGSGPAVDISCPPEAATLAPGDSVTCSAVYRVTQADVDSGSLENTATAQGTPPGGDSVDSPPSEVIITEDPQPGLELVKSADATELVAGETITYSFVLTNTGNVTLTGVQVDEESFNGSGQLSELECPEGDWLQPGEQSICTATYEVTQADVDRGTLENTATATGTPPTGDPITSDPGIVTIPQDAEPGIEMMKTATPAQGGQAGEEITYSFAVTNTGNVTLSGITVNEGEFTGSGELSEVVCPDEAASIVPGQTVTCTATYVLTQADVDAGGVTNTATGTGTPPEGGSIESPPSENELPIVPQPGLDIVKSSDADALVAGETITYSFVVTNTGNTTLTDVAVAEGEFTGSGELSAVECGEAALSLAPGEQITCTATYEVTQADVDQGALENTATATGNPPEGDTIESPPSTDRIPRDAEPGLELVKTADPEQVSEAGEEVAYSFTITNTGNVSVHDVGVEEAEFSGAGVLSAVTCPEEAGMLLPGQSVTCTAAYTVVAADLTGDTLTNVATATGNSPGGDPISSPPSQADVKTVEPEREHPRLPRTGAELAGLLGLTLVLLAAGSGLIYMSRRRSN
ncbi:hypothetical protein GCM10009823_33730 [Brevibacterium salitolerans]|uniref:DUF7507 domain-containing protein n=2 Tax=Brevibacterium salitolerans TaxID=1403566 RepID=A0ABN2X9I3_9MICO